MLSHVHAMLDSQAGMYSRDDFRTAASYFKMPLAIHTKSDLFVHQTQDSLEVALRDMVAIYRANGVKHVQWEIVALDIPKSGRFRVWTDWHHVMADRIDHGASQLTHYCQIQDNRLSVEMVHFVHTPLDAVGETPAEYLLLA